MMSRVFIKTTPVTLKDLQPGDLFTAGPPDYWKDMDKRINEKATVALGEQIWVRNNGPIAPEVDPDQSLFKIDIIKGYEGDIVDVEDLKKQLGGIQ